MHVELLRDTELQLCARAIRKCWASEDRSDNGGEKDIALIKACIAKGHTSVLEHIVYTFDLDHLSRACLQELARHRIASFSVRSTRYTLNKMAKESRSQIDLQEWMKPYLVFPDSWSEVEMSSTMAGLEDTLDALLRGIPPDDAKFLLPENFATSLIITINARSLRNFLTLRLSKLAMWEIRKLAQLIYKELPDSHKFIYDDIVEETT